MASIRATGLRLCRDLMICQHSGDLVDDGMVRISSVRNQTLGRGNLFGADLGVFSKATARRVEAWRSALSF